VTEADVLLQAAVWYDEKNVDFIDACNVAWLLAQGLQRVATFDRKHFARFKGISVMVPGRETSAG
jgi:predicted nucleic acid-binding protein